MLYYLKELTETESLYYVVVKRVYEDTYSFNKTKEVYFLICLVFNTNLGLCQKYIDFIHSFSYIKCNDFKRVSASRIIEIIS